ncbi:uncharacterized protein A4U43_C04F11520 [Asparagus officinalis]|uniref:Ribonuclease H1 N-terminal domain-containing protein n=1 Tax=Asparagus officinalis TaxID=4686 RepID=A0A5P1F024_ASPOF|nr:uncharacterized protein A4U43_C04F11520 [Asparagus officinalis]
MARKSFYVVKRGRRCGTFYNWEECFSQVDRFPNASYKGYATYEEALSEWEKHLSARDSSSSSRHVQPHVCVQEQMFPEGHNLLEDKGTPRETAIKYIFAFVLAEIYQYMHLLQLRVFSAGRGVVADVSSALFWPSSSLLVLVSPLLLTAWRRVDWQTGSREGGIRGRSLDLLVEDELVAGGGGSGSRGGGICPAHWRSWGRERDRTCGVLLGGKELVEARD